MHSPQLQDNQKVAILAQKIRQMAVDMTSLQQVNQQQNEQLTQQL